MVKTKHYASPAKFHHGDTNYTTPVTVANNFNDYFINVGPNLACKMQSSHHKPTDFLGNSIFNTLFFTPTTPEEILNLKSIIKGDKNPGFDDINPSIVNKSVINIVHHLSF